MGSVGRHSCLLREHAARRNDRRVAAGPSALHATLTRAVVDGATHLIEVARLLRSATHPATAVPAPRVEIASPERFASLRGPWNYLVARAAEPNVFMDPAVAKASADARPDIPVHVLLAWDTSADGNERLAGVWTVAAETPDSGLPIQVLRAPGHALSFLGTPVLDAACAEPAFAAMLDAIAADPVLPKVVAIECMGDGGPAMQAITAALRARRGDFAVMTRALRPKLDPTLDRSAYLAGTLSGSSRKKLRQHRRRLQSSGNLVHVSHRTADQVSEALEEFLALEAAGWKGRNGTALVCDAGEARYVRAAVNGLAAHGGASIEALRLGERAVAMQILMRSGCAAFTWKTTYDESVQDCSPGMLLLEDYTAALLTDPALRFADSCSQDESSYMASAWSERQPVTDLLLDVRAGGSVAFHMVAGIERSYREVRTAAKRTYHAVKGSLRQLHRALKTS